MAFLYASAASAVSPLVLRTLPRLPHPNKKVEQKTLLIQYCKVPFGKGEMIIVVFGRMLRTYLGNNTGIVLSVWGEVGRGRGRGRGEVEY